MTSTVGTIKVYAGGGLGTATGAFMFPAMPLVNVYGSFGTAVIPSFLRGLRNLGVNWVLFDYDNVTPTDSANLAYLDQAVAAARTLGFKIVLRQGIPWRQKGSTVAQVVSQALMTIPAMNLRYRPDIASVLHEPSTWDAWLGQSVSATQWTAYVQQMAQASKSAIPSLPVGVAGSNTLGGLEGAVVTGSLSLAQIDGIGAHLYGGSLSTPASWFSAAKSAGKIYWVDEAWRTAFGGAGWWSQMTTANEPSDVSWVKATTPWARSQGVTFFSPFFTNAFYYYSPTTPMSEAALIAATASASEAGKTTATYAAYKALV